MTLTDIASARRSGPKQSIAVIGTGVAGLGAAWALRDSAKVTLFEKRGRLGGHSCTEDIDYDGTPISVDVGFIVYTPRRYPNLTALFDHLGVESTPTKMSYGYSVEGGVEWCSNLLGFAAQKRNMARPSHLKMITEMVRFCLTAKRDLAEGEVRGMRVIDYLERKNYGEAFRERFLLPMAAAIWSSTEEEMKEQDAEAFLSFFEAHGLTDFTRPQWRTVTGGSKRYVAAMERELTADIRLNADLAGVTRVQNGVAVKMSDGSVERFDEVIFACHSDQALALLEDASDEERAYLGAIPFSRNRIVLHRDESLAPSRKLARAAWNSRRAKGDDVSYVTYDMNQLQHIDPSRPLFVTLNPTREPDPALTFAWHDFDHPGMSSASIAARRRIDRIQGVNRAWFAGAWLGYGFHEDGLTSGLSAALCLGGSVPWSFTPGDFTPERARRAGLELEAARSAAQ